MTNEEFYRLFEQMHKEEVETMVGKGKEYTIGSNDKLRNFKMVGNDLGLDAVKVLTVYLYKHFASILNFVKDGVEASNEPIEGRIMDARNYLALLRALIIEERNRQLSKP